jgi:cyanophycin synthetase
MSATPAVRRAITVLQLDHAVGGYLYGLRQPFLKVRLRFDLPVHIDWAEIDATLQAAIPVDGGEPAPVFDAAPLAGTVQRLLHWTAALQRSLSQPVTEAGRSLGFGRLDPQVTVLALPTADHAIGIPALNLVVALIEGALAGERPAAERIAALRPDIDWLTQAGAPLGVSASMNRFLAAAHKAGMPWQRVAAKIFQIGHGARSRWLDSSFTDATSSLGVALARDKAAAARVLRQAGIPVPDHIVVHDETQAVAAAERLGYPVVVKPMDKDGGRGVFAGLKSPDKVRKGFAEAREYSENLLVETFIEGRDYRMVVLHGRLIFAAERIPGGVTGDGVSTVRQLLDRQNSEPPPHLGGQGTLYKLIFDQEAADLLAERGMDETSVPAADLRVRLRSAANVASGGSVRAVFDQVHPDNARLAERAVRALRLDIAGVDLLIPDIGRSWMETGAGVCEVNAQPNFGPMTAAHIYGEILGHLIQGQGRIPIAVIVGAPAGSQACRLVARMMTAAGLKVGIATPDGAWVGADQLVARPAGTFATARALLGDRSVQAAVVAVDDAAVLTTGLPFDRCTVIAFAGAGLADAADDGLNRLARALAPMATARTVLNADDPASLALTPLADAETLLYSAGPKGGEADVRVEAAGERPRLSIGRNAGDALEIELNQPAGDDPILDACSAEDIALAAAVAHGLGCSAAHLRQGLAGVWRQPAAAATVHGARQTRRR